MTRQRATEETLSGTESDAPATRPAAGLLRLQESAGNRAVTGLVRGAVGTIFRSPDLATVAQQLGRAITVKDKADELTAKGRSREAAALTNMIAYADLHPSGPLAPTPDDPGFGLRLRMAVADLGDEMLAAATFADLPERLKAIVFTAEKLNLGALGATPAAKDQEWMTTHDATTGGRSKGVPGSVGTYGAGSWKCNKLVADSYLAGGGAAIGKKNYPMYEEKGGKREWGYKASDLAADVSGGVPQLKPGKELKHFPYSELIHLSADGASIVEIDEFDDKGKRTARFILNGGVFEKHQPDKSGAWQKTVETKDPAELFPGSTAQAGDIVAFHSAEAGVSGHTGLNLGRDLFISAMNATEGVGILSINQHIDPASWDRYDYVGFRSFNR